MFSITSMKKFQLTWKAKRINKSSSEKKKNAFFINIMVNTWAFLYPKDVQNNYGEVWIIPNTGDCKQSRFPLCPDSDRQMIFVINMLILVAGQHLTQFLIQCCLAPFVSLPLPSYISLFPSVIFNKYNMFGATADLLSQSVASPVTQTRSQLQKKNDDACLSRFEPLWWTALQM